MIIDMHTHFGVDVDGERVELRDILLQKEKNQLDYIVAFPFNCVDLLGESQKILRLSQEYNFIIPFLRFDPKTITPRQLDEALSLPYKGVKLHPLSQQFYPDDPVIAWIYPKIVQKNIPVLFHCNTSCYEPMSHPVRMRRVAEAFPALTVIVGHGAGGEMESIKEIFLCPNVYVETSVDGYARFFERAQEMGFDRFMFGSDFPYTSIDIELMKIERAAISGQMKEKMLYENAVKILKLDKSSLK